MRKNAEGYLLRLTADEKKLIEQAAAAAGLSMNEYIRRVLASQLSARSEVIDAILQLQGQLTAVSVITAAKTPPKKK